MADEDLPPVELSEIGRRLDIVTINLAEMQQRYEPVKMLDNAMLVVPTQLGNDLPVLDVTPNRPSYRELGTTGQSIWTGMLREDYNPKLRGRLGLEVYDRMRKSDGQVRATLRLVKTPVLAARWYMEPASNSRRDEKISQFIWDNLTKWMTVSWQQLLSEILLMLDYGYYTFEKVFDEKDGKIIWRKFAPRHPLDVKEWKFDAHGGPEGVWIAQQNGIDPDVFIPIYKLALFTYDMEAGDVTGISVLRSVYKHWFMKENLYKIDAIQKERHGIGIPLIILPANYNDEDMRLADEIGRNLRTNESAHIVLPGPTWEVKMLKMEGQPVNALESIDHHDIMIARNILGQFLNNPAGTSQEEQQQLFLKATRYIAEIVRDVFNKYCIPQIVNWNWPNVTDYPQLRVRRIGDTVDWRTISFAIRNFVGSGLIIPDDNLEEWIRNEMDLPKADPTTARIVVAPQQPGTIPDGQPDSQPGPGGAGAGNAHNNGGAGANPPHVGPPRQGPPSTKGTGNASTGGDASGGK
jgi:hypothetical protein